jgi:glycosyltransferase involved in cell wall biosynthesis
MTVCFICGSYPPVPCGVGDHTATLAVGLRAQDVRVRVITTRRPEVRADGEGNLLPLLPNWSVLQLPKLLRAARATHADLLHIQYPAAGYGRSLAVISLPLVARLTLGIPTVVTIHEWSTRRRWGRFASTLLARLANHVIIPDEVEQARLLQAAPFLKDRVTVVQQTATIPFVPVDVAAVRRELGADESTFVLAFFGLIKPVHRLEILLEVLAELRRRKHVAILLMIGGVAEYAAAEGERYRQSLGRLAVERGVADRVRWSGFLSADRVSTYLQAADACVLPFAGGVAMRNTTFHSVVAHGVPLITSVGANTPASIVDRYPEVRFVLEERFTPTEIADLLPTRPHRPPSARRDADARLGQACTEHVQVYQHVLARGAEGGPRSHPLSQSLSRSLP